MTTVSESAAGAQAPARLAAGERPAGASVLDEARAFVARFAVLPSGAALDALVLWCAHTHAVGAFTASPRLAVTSTEPASGKTFVLDIAGLLCAKPRREVDLTGPAAAALAADGCTVLLDECDCIWGKGGGSSHAQLRAVLNTGYKAGASLTRSAGRDGTKSIPIFGAVALAGLGTLPETLQSRSVPVVMRPRKPEEQVDAFFPRLHEPVGLAIGDALGGWVRSVALDLGAAWPDLPDGLVNRLSELWSPLLAVGDQAGGTWPERARQACRELALGEGGEPALSPGRRLLADLAVVWPEAERKLGSADLCRRLLELEPWRSLWRPESAPRELAALARGLGCEPVKVRFGSAVVQGYHRPDALLANGAEAGGDEETAA